VCSHFLCIKGTDFILPRLLVLQQGALQLLVSSAGGGVIRTDHITHCVYDRQEQPASSVCGITQPIFAQGQVGSNASASQSGEDEVSEDSGKVSVRDCCTRQDEEEESSQNRSI